MNEKNDQKTMRVCPSCGMPFEGDFCTECGEVVEDEPMAVTLSGQAGEERETIKKQREL